MDRTRSTLLMRARDPADAEARGEFVALYEPLLTAYLQHQGLGPDDTRDVVQAVSARLVTPGGRTGAPSIATPGAARSARRPTGRGRRERPAAPSGPVLASRRSGRRPFTSGLSRTSGRPCRPGPATAHRTLPGKAGIAPAAARARRSRPGPVRPAQPARLSGLHASLSLPDGYGASPWNPVRPGFAPSCGL